MGRPNKGCMLSKRPNCLFDCNGAKKAKQPIIIINIGAKGKLFRDRTEGARLYFQEWSWFGIFSPLFSTLALLLKAKVLFLKMGTVSFVMNIIFSKMTQNIPKSLANIFMFIKVIKIMAQIQMRTAWSWDRSQIRGLFAPLSCACPPFSA